MGVEKVAYEYSPFGMTTSVSETDTSLGYSNHIRYKGYYYDIETGLYYLQTRYYDPDTYSYLEPETVNGLNLYAYCGNNPVMNVDPTGHFWDTIFDIGFLIWSIVDVIRDPGDWKNWAALGVDLAFAVIPFVPSGAGQVIKVGNKVDNAFDIASTINKMDNIGDLGRATVIGRNKKAVTRVHDVAIGIGAIDNVYKPWKGWGKVVKVYPKLADGISAAHNFGWMYGKLRSGYKVIDIGLMAHQTSRGLFYGAERVMIAIWKTRNIWKLPINYYW